MADNNADVIVRLIARDEGVKKALTDAGPAGQKALKLLEQSAAQTRPALLAVDSVVKDLKSDMDKLAKDLGPAGKSLKALGPVGFAAAAGLGAALAAGTALSRLGGQTAKDLAALGDQADAAKLSTDAFQALSAEADRTAISQAQLQQALSHVTNAAYDAASGSGQLFETVSRLNPALAQQLTETNNLDDRLNLLARAWQSASSETDRNTLLLAAFGREGAAAGKMLTQLEGGLDGAIERARDMGLVVDENLIRTSQRAAIEIEIADRRIAVAKQNLGAAWVTQASDMKNAWAGLIDFVTGISGGGNTRLENEIERLENFIQDQESRLGRLQNPQTLWDKISAGKNPSGSIRALSADLNRYRDRLAELQGEQVAVQANEDELAGTYADSQAQLRAQADLMTRVATLRAAAKTRAQQQAEAEALLNEAIKTGLVTEEKEIAAIRRHIAETYKDRDAIAAKAKAEREAAAELERNTRAAQAVRAGLMTDTEKLAAREADLARLVSAGTLSRTDAARALALYRDELDGTEEALKAVEAAFEALSTPAEIYAARVAELEQAQARLNLSQADYNRLLAEYARQRDAAEKRDREAAEREQYGDTLEDAKKKILDSLKTANQIIDEKVELQKKIIEALGTQITDSQAREYLAAYRKDLEDAAAKTRKLTDAQKEFEDILTRQIDSWDDVKRAALDALKAIIKHMIQMQMQAKGSGQSGAGGSGGIGGFLSGLFGGSQGGSGAGGTGGFLSGLFSGGGSGGGSGFANFFSAGLDALFSVFHKGTASVGNGRPETRRLPAALLNSAPRYHRGANLRPDEHAAIVQSGERILSRSDNQMFTRAISQLAAGRAAPSPSAGGLRLVLNNYGPPATAEQTSDRLDANGQRELELKMFEIGKRAAVTAIGSGAADQALSQNYGLARRPAGRG